MTVGIKVLKAPFSPPSVHVLVTCNRSSLDVYTPHQQQSSSAQHSLIQQWQAARLTDYPQLVFSWDETGGGGGRGGCWDVKWSVKGWPSASRQGEPSSFPLSICTVLSLMGCISRGPGLRDGGTGHRGALRFPPQLSLAYVLMSSCVAVPGLPG